MEDLNLEDLTLVWLDPLTNVTDDDYSDKKYYLRSIINYLKIFKEPDECIEYVSSVYAETIFFIISGPFAEFMVPLIYDIHQIALIYIYTTDNIEKYDALKKNSYKLSGVFTDISQMGVKLNKDVIFYKKQSMMPMSIFNADVNKITAKEHSVHDLSKESGMFLWSQLLFEALIRMPRSDVAKKDFLRECRHQYKDLKKELEKIDDFEMNYRPNLAIKWYTRDSFLYRLLNKAFRIQDIDIIFDYRFFITDLYDQLSALHAAFIESHGDKRFSAYRGQIISVEELENLRNNIGHHISMNSFLSTTMDRDVALIFAGDISNDPSLKSVLFELEVDPSIKTRKPFANIDKYSYFQNTESEVLFSMGTVFRIESVNQLFDENISTIKLVYIGDNDPQLNDILNFEMKNHNEIDSDVHDSLGYFLYRMGDYDKAVKYFMKKAVDDKNSNRAAWVEIIGNIAMVHLEQGDYEKALAYSIAALECTLKLLPSNHFSVGQIYNNIGLVYFKNKDCVSALENYTKAGEILFKYFPTSTLIPSLYNNIALVYNETGNVSQALEYYNKSLESAIKCWPSTHPNIARTYNGVSSIYTSLHDHDTALQYCQKALAIQEVSLPLNHPDVASTYSELGEIYFYKKDNQQALENFKKCLQIKLHSRFIDHNSIALTYHNVGKVYTTINEYQLGLEHYKKALEYYKKSSVQNYFSIAYTYRDIGHVYLQGKDYEMALNNFEKELDIQLKLWPRDNPSYGSAYSNIGKVYREKNDYTAALNAYHKELELKLESLPANHLSIGNIYGNMCFVHMLSQNYLKAFEYFQKANKISPTAKIDTCNIPEDVMEGFTQYLVANMEIETNIYTRENNPGHMYIESGNYTDAMDYFKRQLKIEKGAERASIHAAIGHIHFCQNDFELALEYFQNALAIDEEINSEPNDMITWVQRAGRYNDLGRAYFNLGNNTLALENYQKASEVQLNLPSNHPDRAQVFNNIGLVYKNMREYDLARLNHEEARDVQKNLKFADDQNCATTYTCLGDIYQINQNYEEAIENFDKAAEIYSNNILLHHKSLITLYTNMANICEKINDCPKELFYYKKVLKVQQSVLPPYHPSLSETYSKLSRIQLKIGDITLAIDSAKEMIEIQLHSEPNNYSELVLGYRTIGRLYEKQNNTEEAFEYMEKALNTMIKANDDSLWQLWCT